MYIRTDESARPLQAGGQLPDELLVDVLMWGIEHEPAPPSPAVASSTAVMQRAAKHVASCRRPGFILDGFPASAAQAWLLHQRLTGCDLAQQQQLLNHGSPLLPELPDKRVSKAEPFHAGTPGVRGAQATYYILHDARTNGSHARPAHTAFSHLSHSIKHSLHHPSC
jgi:hypothetical protein